MDATVLVRGNIRVDGRSAPIAPAKATNDLMGLREEQPYMAWFAQQWPGATTPRKTGQWISAAVPELLTRSAAQLRDRGSLPYGELAPLLEGVRHLPPDRIRFDTLPALGAWALTRAADTRIQISTCGECGHLWLSRRLIDYCYRPAPGKTMTCAQLHAHARFAEHQSEWNREYRRIYARKLRGTVSAGDWERWLQAARLVRPTVLSFEQWEQEWKPFMVSGELDRWLDQWQQSMAKEWGPAEARRQRERIDLDAAAIERRRLNHAARIDAIVKVLSTPSETSARTGSDDVDL